MMVYGLGGNLLLNLKNPSVGQLAPDKHLNANTVSTSSADGAWRVPSG